MLLLNEERISAKEFCEQFNIDISRIKKNPVFELSKKYIKKDKANGAGAMKMPPRITFPARFFFRDKEGSTHELRYATNVQNRNRGGEYHKVYTPNNIKLEAVMNAFRGDEDLAVFVYANPEDLDSPFRGGASKDYMYQHVDNTTRALNRLNNLGDIPKAMEHVKNLSEEELVILAKGLKATFGTGSTKFNPFSEGDHTDLDTLRVNVLDFAHLHPKAYLNTVESDLASLKGRIINMADKKIIELKKYNGGQSSQWAWTKGEKAGQPIGDQLYASSGNPIDYLVNYIMTHLAEYYDALHTISDSLTAEAKALQFLADKKKVVVSETASTEGLPTDFKSAQAWLEDHGFKKLPVLAKQLYEAVNNNQVNDENILGFVKGLVEEQNR